MPQMKIGDMTYFHADAPANPPDGAWSFKAKNLNFVGIFSLIALSSLLRIPAQPQDAPTAQNSRP
ncbi:MAG: hypothetical protein ACI906_005332 [Candidatus Latescibacterota bacterium]|jgi:hypothetical protein